MHYIIPPTKILGKLEVNRVIDYFDEPLMFIATNDENKIYICILVDKANGLNEWYVARISPENYHFLMQGQLPLLKSFTNPMDGEIYSIRIEELSNLVFSEKKLAASELDLEILPDEDDFLRFPQSDISDTAEAVELKASKLNRNILRMKYDFIFSPPGEAPISSLGRLLAAIQDVFNAISQALYGKVTIKGQIPIADLLRAQMSAIGLGPGSFVMDLAGVENQNLFTLEENSAILDEFLDLINLSDNTELFIERIGRLEMRSAARYLKYIKTLQSQVKSVQFVKGTPGNPNARTASIDSKNFEKVIDEITSIEFIAPEEFEVYGTLTRGDVTNTQFNIVVQDEDGKKTNYQGKVARGTENLMSGAILDRKYIAKLIRHTTITKISSEPNEYYELLDLKSLE